jgi:hypothetical protein
MYICTPHVFCCIVLTAGGPHTQDCVIPGAAAAYLVSWSNICSAVSPVSAAPCATTFIPAATASHTNSQYAPGVFIHCHTPGYSHHSVHCRLQCLLRQKASSDNYSSSCSASYPAAALLLPLLSLLPLPLLPLSLLPLSLFPLSSYLSTYLITQFQALGTEVRTFTSGHITATTAVLVAAGILLIFDLMGGMRSVAYTDVLQVWILLIGS